MGDYALNASCMRGGCRVREDRVVVVGGLEMTISRKGQGVGAYRFVFAAKLARRSGGPTEKRGCLGCRKGCCALDRGQVPCRESGARSDQGQF